MTHLGSEIHYQKVQSSEEGEKAVYLFETFCELVTIYDRNGWQL